MKKLKAEFGSLAASEVTPQMIDAWLRENEARGTEQQSAHMVGGRLEAGEDQEIPLA